jgi:hypothetical protein
VIPVAIVLAAVNGQVLYLTWPSTTYAIAVVPVAAGGLLFFGPLFMIVFRRKYPRWWFDWNLELHRFINRVGVYLSLMDDRYPATDDHQSVHLDYAYPDWCPECGKDSPSSGTGTYRPVGNYHFCASGYLGSRQLRRWSSWSATSVSSSGVAWE